MMDKELLFKAFHASPDAIVVTRLGDGRIIEVNDGFSRLFGYSRAEVISKSSLQLGFWINKQDRETVVASLQKYHRIHDYEINLRTKSGETLNCLVSGEVIQLNDETHTLWVVRDITERKSQLEFLTTTLDALPVGVCLTDEQGFYRMMNDAYCAIYEYDREEMLGKHYSVIMPPDQVEIAHTHYARLLNGDVGIPVERKRQRRDGSIVYIEAANALVRDTGGSKLVITTVRDISQRKQTERTLQLRVKLWEYANSNSMIDLMQKALDEIEELTGSLIGFYHFVNEDQNSLSLQAWSTRTMAEFCTAEGADKHYSIDEAGVWVDCVRQREPVIHNDYASLSHRKGMPEGHAEVIRELVVPTLRNGKVVAILGVGNKSSEYDQQDIDLVSYIADLVWEIVEQKQTDEKIRELNTQLERLAMTDDLTGLANRRSFFIRGAHEIKRAKRYHAPLSVLMLDIDTFKNINDRFGHEIGDLTLQCVARTLVENMREIDTAARMGGEEFCVLLPNTKAKDAVILAERLRLAVEQIQCVNQEKTKTMHVTVSIGVASYHAGIENIDTILRHADTAMYQSKNEGRNRVTYLNESG